MNNTILLKIGYIPSYPYKITQLLNIEDIPLQIQLNMDDAEIQN